MSEDIDNFQPSLDQHPWLAGPASPIARVTTWVFIIGSICHLLLGDAWQDQWLMANVLYVAGLILLAWRGAVLGWLFCAVGLAVPLLFMRDILTQSMILLFWSCASAIGLSFDAFRRADEVAPGESANAGDGEWMMLAVFRGVTIATYLLAAFHKLNHDFLNPEYSCANYGVVELLEYWQLSTDLMPAWLALAAPALVLVGELAIPVLHLSGRRHLAWLAAVAFHIPLTLTMAPAFAFVMFAGHAAFATRDDLERIRSLSRTRWAIVAGIGVACTAASVALHGRWPEWTMVLREWSLWALGAGLLWVFPPWKRRVWTPDSGQPPPPSPLARHLAVVACALFILNGLTPYLGVQYQHAGAMVSNLRIDRGCWNHVLVPESVRLTDDYIRVDEVYFGEPGRDEEYEAIVERQLWSPPQIRQMRRNWCQEQARPLYLRGTFRDREFVIRDLCAGKALPFRDAGIFGVEIFGDYLRYQKNLERECPQQCIH